MIPDPESRQTIDSIIDEIREQEWYQEQIANRRIFDTKEGLTGSAFDNSVLATRIDCSHH